MHLEKMLHLPAHLLRRAHQLSTALFAVELPGEDLTAIQYATMIAVAEGDHYEAYKGMLAQLRMPTD